MLAHYQELVSYWEDKVYWLEAAQGRKKLDELYQELEDTKVKAEQSINRVTRLENRIRYKMNRRRRDRAHQLITKGAAIESIVPDTKYLYEVDFYELMEEILSLPEAQRILERRLKGGD